MIATRKGFALHKDVGISHPDIIEIALTT